MLRSLISIELILHVIAGYCGAFVAFPLAIAARKGTDWHRLSGRLFVGCFLVICITGYILNWDELLALPVFRSWGDPGGAQGLYQPSEPLAMRELTVLGTASVNTFALYLAISGWRVWARRRALEAGKPQRFDQVLAVVELVACAVFVVAFWQLIPVLGLSALLRLPVLAVAVVPALDALNDLVQSAAAQAPQQWWLLHLRKLAMAEAGLLAAVALRCVPSPYVLISMLLSVLIVVIPTLLIIRARLRSQHSD